MHFPSEWFRFDRYVVADGFIRPARGAKLGVYAPWQRYQQIRALSGTDPVAYHGLMNVLATVRKAPKNARQGVRAKYTLDEQQLLTWVSRNGLLGIAHSQLVLSSTPARAFEDGVPRRAVSFFSGGRWCNVLEDEAPRGNSPKVNDAWVISRDLLGGHVLRTAAVPWWRTFLPGVGNPIDLDFESEQFRRAYAEPVSAFVDAAVLLRTSIRAVTPGTAEGESPPPPFELGAVALNGLLASGHTSLALGTDGRLKETWTAPSLLTHLAMMVLRDVGDHRHLVKCEVCGNTVIRSKPSKFCSDTHRLTAEKRRQRAKAAGKTGPR